ncbi:hypothetical protein K493DRAFT_65224 [Basidiobolus meristosporus CBS 931.73]|uniref:Uncharacterized protein n=1 Tax=Basidiobolus meristosporus CBS 931.73 TaxID=1314790 RepID=A0A1Y1XVM3_9FUNG|nr:hypothetical protein K493DRAFT_65224 [Basidiobolus meristosporus CBS 931.73]|eukprot:ORX89810.1 hypothetical protein K493DRAFT_65224 [Basidiobolus meristosporus CBS 931.73]
MYLLLYSDSSPFSFELLHSIRVRLSVIVALYCIAYNNYSLPISAREHLSSLALPHLR